MGVAECDNVSSLVGRESGVANRLVDGESLGEQSEQSLAVGRIQFARSPDEPADAPAFDAGLACLKRIIPVEEEESNV
ncbi:hypothetical protein [Natronosalvus rutilus]|uniref:Uncharacterized protein n=1 Tax=Natronosalvus rutilus TaxID=2953753 RepID=A0A9E7ND24_9EURY|nr:hypothetical protein [Natronosalvus rutilus]UTF54633.1 hypothetical protein NGM29_04990 [Natronosalvus rutilus]